MIPTAADADGTHPLERIAISLERISHDLHKIANPPMAAKGDLGSDFNKLPGEFTLVR